MHEASVPECQWGVSSESDLRCWLGLQYLGLSSEPACELLPRWTPGPRPLHAGAAAGALAGAVETASQGFQWRLVPSSTVLNRSRRFAHSESSSTGAAARVRWDPVEDAQGVFGCVADNAPAALLDPPIVTGGSRVAPSCGPI